MLNLQILLTFTLSSIVIFASALQENNSLQHFRSKRHQESVSQHGHLEERLDKHEEELTLLDTVLLASVDGRFHAVNRTSGRTIWTMDNPLVLPLEVQSNLYPLVRTQHPRPNYLPDDLDFPSPLDDDEFPETYIIEPQTGAIFVNPPAARRDDPLLRLPFTMAKLVEMSPFRFEDRTFVGKKQTSLITMDLRTGEIMEILDPERCGLGDAPKEGNVLLDELEEDTIPVQEKMAIHIGRTDYHVSVFSGGRIVQNMTFTSYGPNNMDKPKQDLWHSTPDHRYHQPLHDGSMILFRLNKSPTAQTSLTFQRPIVAVFDAVSIPDRKDPLMLLQPVPKLSELYATTPLSPTDQQRLDDMTKLELTHVDRIGDSLFAMSHLHFPLISFERFTKRSGSIGSGEDDGREHDPYDDYPYGGVCRTFTCLLGIHFTESDHSTRLTRLLEAGDSKSRNNNNPPALPTSTIAINTPPLMLPEAPTKSTTIIASPVPPHSSSTTPLDPALPGHHHSQLSNSFSPVGTSLLTALTSLLAVIVWYFVKKIRATDWTPQREDLVFQPVPQMNVSHIQNINKALPPVPIDAPSTPPPADDFVFIEPHRSLSVPTLPLSPNRPAPSSQPASTQQITTLSDNPENPQTDAAGDDDGEGDSDKDGVGQNGVNGGLKKRRRKRGRGGKKAVVIDAPEVKEKELEAESSEPQVKNGSTDSAIIITAPPRAAVDAFASSLVVSDNILGFGSHGTVVFKGSFQGRAVAVKRLLSDFVTLATREVTLLQESDDHPNVIRYYFKESKDNFLYIALELCPASLADIVERAGAETLRELVAAFEPKRALAQVTAGLRHLHALKIVHRDIKPQNILVSAGKKGGADFRMLISDFGLCRKLDMDQTSFLPTHIGGAGAGTVGWRAPEILRGEVKLDEQTGDMSSGSQSVGSPSNSIGGIGSSGSSRGGSGHVTRLTKSVDVFALGILFYYTLTGGEHPFGDRYERESNILKNLRNLTWLERLGEEGMEADDLIGKMLDMDPKTRPDTTDILLHPFFWTPAKRLGFLQDASDRFEIMERDPREPPLIALEMGAFDIVGIDWHKRLDKVFVENLGKFRKYDGRSVQDLLRAFRNKKHHYQDLPENVKRTLGPLPHGFLAYFTKRFPRLFLHVYSVIALDPFLRSEAMFKAYFDYVEQ